MQLKDITVNSYRYLKEVHVCMTSGAKVEFGPVRQNCLSSATNNYVDKAQLQLCYFAPLPELCGQKPVSQN